MAYQLLFSGNRITVRCTSGKDAHMRQNIDGSWLVEEDPDQRLLEYREAALDRARELAEDPDWPSPR